MHIGCPKEIKPQEFRVGLTPAAAREAIGHGHRVTMQTGAGEGAGFSDDDYRAVGAEIADTAEAVFAGDGPPSGLDRQDRRQPFSRARCAATMPVLSVARLTREP